MIRRFVPHTLALAALLGAGIAACDSTTGPDDTARIRIHLTDAPADYIESAQIWVSAVYLQRDDDDGEGDPRVYLFDDKANPKSFDLMLLRDGITADLTGVVDVEPGDYGQLRLIVDSAFVTLKAGYEFRDGGNTAPLKVPSGSRSGIKVQLDDEIDAEGGALVDLVVDFDVNENFKLQGNPETPAGINGILFTPSLKEKSRSVED